MSKPSDSSLRRIVLVEDEPALRENYTLALSRAGFHVSGFGEAHPALQAMEQQLPDIVIIDVGLGHDTEAGFELCRRLRERSAQLPILFLSARDSEVDIISGLRLGADDYVTKDISLAQLIARVHTLLRRVNALSQAGGDHQVRRLNSLELHPRRLTARWNEQPLGLTVTEYAVVECLTSQPGQVCTRRMLMQAADVVLDDQTMTAHIKRIRAKFVAIDPGFSAIQTVYSQGYRWVDE